MVALALHKHEIGSGCFKSAIFPPQRFSRVVLQSVDHNVYIETVVTLWGVMMLYPTVCDAKLVSDFGVF